MKEKVIKTKFLKDTFGHNTFRLFQEETVDSILNHRDVLTILPTGGGKSLCYQLPALMMDGITVVISPLIALMQDQVLALSQLDVKAKMINSSQSIEENEYIYQELLQNKLKFIYVAPERFVSNDFISVLHRININYFVIDEAHCVSEWGHEFRSEYRNLNRLKQMFPNTTIAAFTATATKKVEADIIKSLNLNSPTLLRGKTKRDNLNIDVRKRVSNGRVQLLNFVNEHKNDCGIIYTYTRKETESIAKFLVEKNISAKAYHAGLPTIVKDEVFKDFTYDRINIVVATIAFGMGIDKSNIRFVIHTAMPKTMENYYQEIGRAGRDGMPSNTLLLYSKADEVQKRVQIDDLPNGDYKNLIYKKLAEMYQFCITSDCRHKRIANYFDDEIENCESLCDNCTKGEVKQVDISIDSMKFLSAVLRSEQKFGQNHIIDILRGSKNQKIKQFGHDTLSVYGIGSQKSKNEWNAICDRLFDLKALYIGDHKVLKIDSLGSDILKKKVEVVIDFDKLGHLEKEEIQEHELSFDEKIYQEFKSLRTQIANEQNVPAYIIFGDKTLLQLSQKLPVTKEEMLEVHGIGESKVEKYGDVFLELCKSIKPEQVKQPKKLTDTYLKTLELIEEDNDISTISQIRELQLPSIALHINLLHEHKKISDEKRNELINQIVIPEEIKNWCLEGLEFEDLKQLRQYLYLFELTNNISKNV